MVRHTQSTFMQGRDILKGLSCHETMHNLQRNKMSGVNFTIDFEKVYDEVKLSFSLQGGVLRLSTLYLEGVWLLRSTMMLTFFTKLKRFELEENSVPDSFSVLTQLPTCLSS